MSGEETIQVITLCAGGIDCAIALNNIQEIIRCCELNSIPSLPDSVEGIIDLRGRVVPVLDLGKRMGFFEEAESEERKIVVVGVGLRVVGLIVDSVSKVTLVDKRKIEAPAGIVAGNDFISGVMRLDGRLIAVIEPSKLFDDFDFGSVDSAVVSEKELADGTVEVTRRVSGMGGDMLMTEIVERSQAVIDKQMEEGKDVKVVKEMMEQVRILLDSLASGDIDRAEMAIEAMLQPSDGTLFNEVGKVTRKLFNSLNDFKLTINPTLKCIATNDLPDASSRLTQVISATEEAANKTIEKVEEGIRLQSEMGRRLDQFNSDMSKWNNGKRIKKGEILHNAASLVEDAGVINNQMSQCLQDTLMVQSFQDLTGQALKKVIPVVEEVEQQLLSLVKKFGIQVEKQRTDVGEGQNETVNQDDVDNMLAAFGF